MEREAVSLVVGAVLLIAALLMMRAHRRAWVQQQNDPSLEQADREHLRYRYRRRMQTSGLLAVLGPLLAAGPVLVPAVAARVAADPRQQMIVISIYWIVVLLLTLWVILMGMGDYLATATHARGKLAQLRRAESELQQHLDGLRGGSDREAGERHEEQRE